MDYLSQSADQTDRAMPASPSDRFRRVAARQLIRLSIVAYGSMVTCSMIACDARPTARAGSGEKSVDRSPPSVDTLGAGDSNLAAVVSAEMLTAAYRADIAASDQKYSSQELTVEGTITNLIHDDATRPDRVRGVDLAGCFENELHPLRVRCLFAAAHETDLVDLQPGQRVRVRGQWQPILTDDSSDVRPIELAECVLRPCARARADEPGKLDEP